MKSWISLQNPLSLYKVNGIRGQWSQRNCNSILDFFISFIDDLLEMAASKERIASKEPNSQSIWHYIILKRTCFLFFFYGRIFKTFLRGTAKENINWNDKFSSCGWKLKIYRRFLFLFCLKKRIQDKSILDNFIIY